MLDIQLLILSLPLKLTMIALRLELQPVKPWILLSELKKVLTLLNLYFLHSLQFQALMLYEFSQAISDMQASSRARGVLQVQTNAGRMTKVKNKNKFFMIDILLCNNNINLQILYCNILLSKEIRFNNRENSIIQLITNINQMSQLFRPKKNSLTKLVDFPTYQHPASLYNLPIRSISQQRQQVQGKLQFGANLYSSKAQENLIKSLVQSRTKYRSSQIQQRMTIADRQYECWKNYLQERIQQLPQEYRLTEQHKQNFYECYLILKERSYEKFLMDRTIKILNQFSKLSKMDMFFHPIVLHKLIHPHFGYINNYSHVRLSFSELMGFFQELLAVSKILDEENSLHSDQMLSFVFWKLNCDKATMTLDQFCSYLKFFKFKVEPEEFGKEFEWTLKNKEGEMKGNEVIRFDLWRSIFLQRGL